VSSAYLTGPTVGLGALVVFSAKSFLLGSAIGAVAVAKKTITTERVEKGHRVKDKNEVDDPSGVWFVGGFGAVTAIGAFFLIAGWMAATTLFTFFFGFMFVLSGAAKELMGAREFVSTLAYAVIALTLLWANFAFFTWAWPLIFHR